MTVMKINAVAFLEGKTPRLIFDVPRESGFFRVFSHLLMDQDEMEAIWYMRRALGSRDVQDVTETILDNLAHTRDNKTFIDVIKKIKLD